MKITPKQAKFGYFIIGVAMLLFLGYWYYLLEPLQTKLIDAGKQPNLIITVIRSLVAGTAFAFLTFIGFALGGFAWQKWAKSEDLKLGDALESSSFITWAAWTNVLFMLFSLLWHYDI